MTRAAVVDTNVGVVANGDASHASGECVERCCDRLLLITRGQVQLVLDDGFEVFGEYQQRLSLRGAPGLGDAFMKWVHDNQFNPVRCHRVQLTRDPDRVFEEFPDDPDLEEFDRSDRKFAAVARASRATPPVWNAVDSDWWEFQRVFDRHGVAIEHVCPDMIEDWRRNRTQR